MTVFFVRRQVPHHFCPIIFCATSLSFTCFLADMFWTCYAFLTVVLPHVGIGHVVLLTFTTYETMCPIHRESPMDAYHFFSILWRVFVDLLQLTTM